MYTTSKLAFLFSDKKCGGKDKMIKEKIEKLRRELTHHAKLYYVYDSPVISDYEYDMMFAELKRLEEENPEFFSPDSPTQRVGGKPLDNLLPLV